MSGGMGIVTSQFTIWCAGCQVWQQEDGPRGYCKDKFKLAGWKKRGNKGEQRWYCKDCQEKFK